MAAAKKQTVLITGCSEGGIGFALAEEYHRRGLRVFATARNLAKVKHLQEAGFDVVQLDVIDKQSILHAVEKVSELTGGTLDILVNNAGNGYQVSLLDADLDEAKRLFDVNVWGVLSMTQAFAPLLAASAAQGGRPRVVNIGSVCWKAGVPWQGIYNASKGALYSLNDTMRVELQPLGITVIHIVTGGIKTKFFANASGRQTIPETSLYAPVAAEIQKNVDGHAATATQTMSAEEYARKVVANTLSSWPTVTMWIGGLAFLSWLGARLGLDGINDMIIGYKFDIPAMATKLKLYRGQKKPE
ncbi:putative short-chain dehydrogenase/reductase [Xylariales sp. PMI_506]|nr:putative short-chain dehydrogenase/reductase [Xylariales sp. PMI_506]